MAKKISTIYFCANCGNEFSGWSGRCSVCGEWNSLKAVKENLAPSLKHGDEERITLSNLSDISSKVEKRFNTGIFEFDRVIGGGIVNGSIILLGGEPGIGKSTLIMQVCNAYSSVLYISAEESYHQVKLRAERLGIDLKKIDLYSGSNIEGIEKEILAKKPDLVVIDSIQTVTLGSIPSTPGSLVQVRETGVYLQKIAKSLNVPVVLVGHVTKDGFLAGPKILEHLVDVVLYLEGDRFHEGRILRSIKNRFGPTNEVGVFTLLAEGMKEVSNPSEILLSERQNEPGSVITVSLEGNRPILLEVQALVHETKFGYPKRASSGFDLNRLNLLAAVISKKTPINLLNSDIYLNVVGGFKVKDPGMDLAVCLAIISSCLNKSLPAKNCLFGEVGLAGEIRKVSKQKERASEAKRLGYELLENKKNLREICIGLGLLQKS